MTFSSHLPSRSSPPVEWRDAGFSATARGRRLTMLPETADHVVLAAGGRVRSRNKARPKGETSTPAHAYDVYRSHYPHRHPRRLLSETAPRQQHLSLVSGGDDNT